MKRNPALPGLLAFAILALVGCDGSPGAAAPGSSASLVAPAVELSAGMADTDGAEWAALRRATAKYHRIEVALDDGFFAPDGECVEVEGLGGMGVHYVHPDNLNDALVDPEKPDALLYEPQKNGHMRLVGAEFVIWRDVWGDPPGPTFLGRDFDQSFGEHSHGLPDHYELHLWIWRDNPAGIMTPFNPAVRCP